MTRWLHRAREWTVGLVALGVATVIVGGAAGSTTLPASSNRAASGSLTVAWPLDVAGTLEPRTAPGIPQWWLFNMVYDSLTAPGQKMGVAPRLATSWRVVRSKQRPNKIWVFNIRHPVRFSNGRLMTMADVVGSLRRFIDPQVANTWRPFLGDVADISQSGPWQVKITLKTRNSWLPAALANPEVAVLPMKELQAGTFDPAKQMIGTGPFTVVGHSQGESWTFARNRYYWRKGLPKADRVIAKIIPDETARLAAVRSGDVSYAYFDNPSAVRLLRGAANVRTKVLLLSNYSYLGANALTSMFKDVRLRRAVAMAVNRFQIIRLGLDGVGAPTAASPRVFGVCKPGDMPFANPNLAAARQLVNAAGAQGKTVNLIAPSFGAEFLPIAQVLQQNLNAIGLNVRVVPTDTSGYLRALAFGGKPGDATFDLYVSRFAGYVDPAMVLTFWDPVGTFTSTFMPRDQALARSILRSKLAPEGPKRTAHIVDACKRAAQDAVIIPLVTKAWVLGYRSDRVTPRIQSGEGFSNPFLNIAEFTPRG